MIDIRIVALSCTAVLLVVSGLILVKISKIKPKTEELAKLKSQSMVVMLALLFAQTVMLIIVARFYILARFAV